MVAADERRLTEEKRCGATKENMPMLRSASSAEGMITRRTLAAIIKESADAKHPFN